MIQNLILLNINKFSDACNTIFIKLLLLIVLHQDFFVSFLIVVQPLFCTTWWMSCSLVVIMDTSEDFGEEICVDCFGCKNTFCMILHRISCSNGFLQMNLKSNLKQICSRKPFQDGLHSRYLIIRLVSWISVLDVVTR